MITTIIVSILLLAASSIYVNFFNSIRNIKAANKIYDEARFTLERIVQEVRSGTIDYEEYYNQLVNFQGQSDIANETLGSNYCQYNRQFFSPGPDGSYGTFDDESTGAIDHTEQTIPDGPVNKLFLINNQGDRRSYIRRIETIDAYNNTIGKVAMLRLAGKDYGVDNLPSSGESSCAKDRGEKDQLIDTWVCDDGFNCKKINKTVYEGTSDQCTAKIDKIIDDPTDLKNSSFIDITPDDIDIIDLKFFIAPKEDPRKGYAMTNIQIQPHVTIKLIASANPKLSSEFKGGERPTIVLETTVSSRAQREITSECNLQECIDGSKNACPGTLGICQGATQICSHASWPGCSDETLKTYVDEYSKTSDTNINSTYYENHIEVQGSEIGICKEKEGINFTNCIESRCSDNYDNDCNGRADDEDYACLDALCRNGDHDNNNGEECIDVGGPCANYPISRPKLEKETGDTSETTVIRRLCTDGFDNDCDGLTDADDEDCKAWYCTNRQKDTSFTDNTKDEECVDIGGLCEGFIDNNDFDHSNTEKENTDTMCKDRLDNDCDSSGDVSIDELDPDCQAIICINEITDCDLMPSDISMNDIFTFSDPNCTDETDNDEKCIDIGGLCEEFTDTDGNLHNNKSENDQVTCNDGLDNDCDGGIDGNAENYDTECCIDADGDNYISESNPLICSITENLDCNDSVTNINPGAKEICDGFTDHDCGKEENDFKDDDCCIDLDEDNYGEPGSSGDRKFIGCSTFSNPILDSLPDWDCNPQNENVFPDIANKENTPEKCRDGLNNDCSITCNSGTDLNQCFDFIELLDHIDMHTGDPGNTAYSANNYDPNCCTETIEFCNDHENQYDIKTGKQGNAVGDSDNDCNGLLSEDDRFCVDSDGKSIFINFTENSLINSLTDTEINGGFLKLIDTNTDGDIISIDLAKYLDDLTTSKTMECAGKNISSITLKHSGSNINYGTNLKYFIDNTGSAGSQNFEEYLNIESKQDFSNQNGKKLFWKAELTGDGSNPQIDWIRLSFTCQ